MCARARTSETTWLALHLVVDERRYRAFFSELQVCGCLVEGIWHECYMNAPHHLNFARTSLLHDEHSLPDDVSCTRAAPVWLQAVMERCRIPSIASKAQRNRSPAGRRTRPGTNKVANAQKSVQMSSAYARGTPFERLLTSFLLISPPPEL